MVLYVTCGGVHPCGDIVEDHGIWKIHIYGPEFNTQSEYDSGPNNFLYYTD